MQRRFNCGARWHGAVSACILLALFGGVCGASAKFSSALQGQSKGNTNWIGNNLQGWQDLDYIPMRVYLTGGPAAAQSIQVYFDHFRGSIPGIEDLTGFTASLNVVITSGPTLIAPADSGTWYYGFTINLTDKSPGYVQFRGRLAAGAHLNPGSSLHLGGTPSLSTLQIFKPAPASGNPDLAVYKHGPAHAPPGAIITYTIDYTNSSTSASGAYGVQLSDTLPLSLTYVVKSASSSATQIGDSLFWDLGSLARGAHGTVTFQATVNSNAVNGQTFTNYTQIYSEQDDANYADNVSRVITAVMSNRPPVALNDAYVVNEDTTLVVPAPGVLANDSDVDGDSLVAVLANGPAHGDLVWSPSGSFAYTPDPEFNGTDTFTYQAQSGTLDSGPAMVTITVQPVNDPPSFSKGPNQLVNEDAPAQSIANWATNISPGPPDEAGQVMAFLVTNDTNSLFSVQPALSPVGVLTYAPAPHAYGVAHVVVVLKDDGGTANGGNDTSAPQTFTITVNAPPTVSIIEPTNQTVFVAPANFTIIAEANDVDGTVSQVRILQGTNLVLLQTNPAPYLATLTNVMAGTYQFTAQATDNLGASGVSAPVTVTVLDDLPLLVVQSPRFNPQTGLFEEVVRVLNPTPVTLTAVRVLVSHLGSGMQVFNASGTASGIPYAQLNQPILPGGTGDLTIEYYAPAYQTPTPSLAAQVTGTSGSAASTAVSFVPVTRQLRLRNGEFLLEFSSSAGRIYFVQYSLDMKAWQTAWPSVVGTGNRIQWLDNGPPRTEQSPVGQPGRFYRVVLAP